MLREIPEKCGSRFSKRRFSLFFLENIIWKISLRKTKPEATALIACRNELKRFRKALESCHEKCCSDAVRAQSGSCAERKMYEKECLERNEMCRTRHSVTTCGAVTSKQREYRLEINRINNIRQLKSANSKN